MPTTKKNLKIETEYKAKLDAQQEKLQAEVDEKRQLEKEFQDKLLQKEAEMENTRASMNDAKIELEKVKDLAEEKNTEIEQMRHSLHQMEIKLKSTDMQCRKETEELQQLNQQLMNNQHQEDKSVNTSSLQRMNQQANETISLMQDDYRNIQEEVEFRRNTEMKLRQKIAMLEDSIKQIVQTKAKEERNLTLKKDDIVIEDGRDGKMNLRIRESMSWHGEVFHWFNCCFQPQI